MICRASRAMAVSSTRSGQILSTTRSVQWVAKGALELKAYQDDDWVVVEVADNGPGIPTEAQENIFDPFYTTKAPGEGTGLGLNISHGIIVEKHAGHIAVNSKPGATRFTVKLPITNQTSTIGRGGRSSDGTVLSGCDSHFTRSMPAKPIIFTSRRRRASPQRGRTRPRATLP